MTSTRLKKHSLRHNLICTDSFMTNVHKTHYKFLHLLFCNNVFVILRF